MTGKGAEDAGDAANRANYEPESDPDEPDGEVPAPPQPWDPSDKEKADLKIAHDNSGHPLNRDFARLLRRGNAKPEVT